MPDYEKMYYSLFNAVTDALELLEASLPEPARVVLICAQQTSEEMFLTSPPHQAAEPDGFASCIRRPPKQQGRRVFQI